MARDWPALYRFGAWRKPDDAPSWAVFVLGAVLLLIGIVLLGGGVALIRYGGSWYYALAGLGLIAAGVPIMQRNVLGAWIYDGVFAATALWAFWEAGLNGWALAPRLLGPFILLILIILSLPVLTREHGRMRRLYGLAGCAIAAIVVGLLVGGNQARAINTVSATAPASAADPSPMPVGENWPAYGGAESAQRYSPLSQITPANVSQLKRAWVFRTGDIPEERWGAETTPIKVGDTLFLCTARNILIAVDAASGKQKWRYDPKVPEESIPYTAACRGVTFYQSAKVKTGAPCASRIVEGTLDARLIAVDAMTGAPCAGFGTHGAVDITVGMGQTPPGYVSINSPPVIVRGVIVTGHQVLDGQNRWAPSGVIQGYDAETGQLRWAWDMMRPDIQRLPPAGQTYTRGTPNMWTAATGDEKLGLVYLPMGNSAADYWSSTRRPQESGFATSLVALNVQTGRPVWRFQTTHIDVWDYDLGSQPTLVDFPTPSGPRAALILASKQGDIYVLDRQTGQPLTGVRERPVPQGGVEPWMRSKTQPFSLYHTLAKRNLQERDMWGMSPIDQMICRIQFRRATYKGMYTPPTTATRFIEYPGYNGGSDWGGLSVDTQRGVIVANYNDMPNYNRLVPRDEADRLGWAPRAQARGGKLGGGAEGAGDPQANTPFAIQVNAGWRLPLTGLLCKEPPYGGIRAIDLKTGKTIWDRPFGEARRNGPWNIPSMLPITIGTPNNGGPLTTAGGLIFIGAATDDLLHAINIADGKTVWRDALPAGGQATPMTYAVNGKQYVVIMAGGHHFMQTPAGDYLIAYALDAKR